METQQQKNSDRVTVNRLVALASFFVGGLAGEALVATLVIVNNLTYWV